MKNSLKAQLQLLFHEEWQDPGPSEFGLSPSSMSYQILDSTSVRFHGTSQTIQNTGENPRCHEYEGGLGTLQHAVRHPTEEMDTFKYTMNIRITNSINYKTSQIFEVRFKFGFV
jgi:hypothetical protein